MSGRGRVWQEGRKKNEPARRGVPWYFVVDMPAPAGERRQVRRRGFATKDAAQTALDEFLAEARAVGYSPKGRATLADFLLGDWLPAKEATLKPTTFTAY